MSLADCPICFDCLSTSPVGVAIPCGHCFHRKCYNEWETVSKENNCRKSKGEETRAECPSCREYTNGFYNLFLDLSCCDSGGSDGEKSEIDDEEIGDMELRPQVTRQESISKANEQENAVSSTFVQERMSFEATSLPPQTAALVSEQELELTSKKTDNKSAHENFQRKRIQKLEKSNAALRSRILEYMTTEQECQTELKPFDKFPSNKCAHVSQMQEIKLSLQSSSRQCQELHTVMMKNNEALKKTTQDVLNVSSELTELRFRHREQLSEYLVAQKQNLKRAMKDKQQLQQEHCKLKEEYFKMKTKAQKLEKALATSHFVGYDTINSSVKN